VYNVHTETAMHITWLPDYGLEWPDALNDGVWHEFKTSRKVDASRVDRNDQITHHNRLAAGAG